MNDKEEIDYLRDTLAEGAQLLCSAAGVDIEHYDTDQAEGECFLDCFRGMAMLLKQHGYYYCKEDAEFKTKPLTP